MHVLAGMTWMLLTMHLAAWQAVAAAPRPDAPVEHAMLFVEVPPRRYHLRILEPDPDVVYAVRRLRPVR